MRTRTLLLSLTVSAMAMPPAAIAAIVPVSGSSSQLQTEVALASHGDVLVVEPGTYLGPLLIDGKSISIVARVPNSVSIDGCYGGSLPTIEIKNSPPGATTLLAGLQIAGCSMVTTGVRFIGSSTSGALRLEDCVVLGYRTCVEISGGRVTMLRTQVFGDTFLLETGSDGGLGISIQDAVVDIHGCSAQGGNGTAGSTFGTGGGDGGVGIRVGQSTLLVRASSILGGNGAAGGQNPGHGGDGLQTTANATVIFSQVTTAGGLGGPFSPFSSAPPGLPENIDASSTLTQTGKTPRSIALNSPKFELETVNFSFSGLPGDNVILLVGAVPILLPLPQFGSALCIGTPNIVVALGGAPSGSLQFSTLLAPLPVGIDGVLVFAQAIGSGSAGDPFVANANSLLILDT